MTVFIIIVVAMIWCLCFVMIVDGNRFVVREYNFTSPAVKKNLKAVLLADLHNKEYGKDNYKLIEAIREINPDVIFCSGDMIVAREGKNTDAALKFFSYIKDYPVYYGIGNHEYRMKIYRDIYGNRYDEYKRALEEMGIKVLENESFTDEKNKLFIQGIMIDREYYKRSEKMEMPSDYIRDITGLSPEALKGEKPVIMLAHNPEYFQSYCEAGGDLILSGHVHGGIMRLPFLGGVISPRLKLFPEFDGGCYKRNGRMMILSRGLGSHTIPVRIFNPGELSVIHFNKN